MRKRVGVLPVLALIACLVCAFLWQSNRIGEQINDVNAQLDDSRIQLTNAQNEQAQLKEDLQTVDTEAFIENQARSLYGYMKRDEIRFVITNPEALYGDEAQPIAP